MLKRFFFSVFCGLAIAPSFAQDFSHVKVELLPEQSAITPGGSVTVGFHFRMQRGWHIYWQNPGDAGQAPSITWSLPDGFTAGDILWPVPQLITANSLADFGYTNEVLLMVPIQCPPDLKPGHFVRLSAHLRWLVCNEICIPGDASLNLRFLVHKHKSAAKSRNEFLFQAARRNQPLDLPEDWKVDGTIGKKDFHVRVDTGASLGKAVTACFIPLHQNQVEAAAGELFHPAGNSFQLTLKRSDQLSQDVKTLDGVLEVKDKKSTKGYNVTIPLSE